MAYNENINVKLTGDSVSYRNSVVAAKAATESFSLSMGGAARGIAAIDSPLGGISGRLSSISSLFGASATGVSLFGAAIAAASAVTYASIKTFDEYEQQQLKTQALLESTGYAAGLTAKELSAQADALALSTLASVSGVKEAQQVMLTFRTVQGDTFKESIKLAQDMAAVFGGDLKSKATQLGKALEDPIAGITALKESGVSFSNSERALIKSLDESGRKAEAQGLILEKLRVQVGGAGSAQAGGVSGAVDTLSQRWDELMRTFAEKSGSAGIATKFMNTLAAGINNVTNSINPDAATEINELVKKRMELRQKLVDLDNGKNTSLWSVIVGTKSERMNIDRELTEVTNRIQELQNKRVDELKEQNEAQKKADAARAQAEAEAAADRLAKQSEELAKKKQKQDEADQADLAQLRRTLADKETQEMLAWQERQEKLNALIERGNIKDQEFHELTAQNYKRYQEALTEHQETEADKREKARKAEQLAAIQGFRSTTGEFLTALETSGRKSSAIYKAAFAAQKLAAIPSMIVSTEEAATKALTLGPVAGLVASGAIRGMGYASIGLVAGQTIAGVAHGGMGYIPEESTYLLQRGEAVLSPKQNVAVTAAAEKINAGASGAVVNVHLHEDASKAGKVTATQGSNGETEIHAFVADIMQGGQRASTLERTYGLRRQGR